MASNFLKIRNGIGLTPLTSVPSNPIRGDLYYDDTLDAIRVYDGTDWVAVGSGGWSLTGNSATNPVTDFIGTTDNVDLVFRTNNIESLRVLNSGTVAIGTATPNNTALLQIDSTTKGFLPPRMTEAERDLIVAPAAGLIVYNATTNELNIFDGVSWVAVGSGGPGGSGETVFNGTNNQSTPANVTDVVFDGSISKTVKLLYSIYRFHTGEFEGTRLGTLSLTYKPNTNNWELLDTFAGDGSGVAFSITNLGQLQYISDNKAGTQTEFEMKFLRIDFTALQSLPVIGPEMSVLKVRGGTPTWEVDFEDLTKKLSNKEAGAFKTVEWFDDAVIPKLRKRSVVSGGIAPQFTTRTVTFYDVDGITLLNTRVYALAYDIDGDLEEEVLQ